MDGRTGAGRRALVAITVAVSCGSCSPGFGIEVSGRGEDVMLSFKGPWASRLTPCVYELQINEERWPNRRAVGPVWSIKSASGCVVLRSVRIGALPAGFTAEVDRLPLKLGHMYGVRATARYGEGGEYSGAALPWFVCREETVTIRWKDEYKLEDPPRSCVS
jgi:hypothetical protein